MKRFTDGQRIAVAASDNPLVGRLGTVRRIRYSDSGAWVRMDEELPPKSRLFDPGDERERDALLFPEDCEPALGNRAGVEVLP